MMMHPTLKGKTLDWVVSEYESGKTLMAVANKIGCSRQAVQQFLEYHGIARRSLKTHKGNPKYRVVLKGIKDKKCLKDIISEVKSSSALVKRIARENSLTIYRKVRGYGPLNKDWLYNKYIKEGLSAKTIAKLLKIKTYPTVIKYLRKYGIPIRPRGRYVSNNMNLLRNKLWLYKAYVGEGLSIAQLAKMSGSYYSTVQYWLKKHQIPNKRDPQIKSM